jgi:hypothetical protein
MTGCKKSYAKDLSILLNDKVTVKEEANKIEKTSQVLRWLVSKKTNMSFLKA